MANLMEWLMHNLIYITLENVNKTKIISTAEREQSEAMANGRVLWILIIEMCYLKKA